MVEKIRAAILLHKDLRNKASADLMQVTFLVLLRYCYLCDPRVCPVFCTLTARLISFLDSAWRNRSETWIGFGARSSQNVQPQESWRTQGCTDANCPAASREGGHRFFANYLPLYFLFLLHWNTLHHQ
jgi:hypothetical protein